MTLDVPHHVWRCPACGDSLQVQQKQWLCANQHSFDMAKEGYVNLLLAQHKNSKAPGDNKEMVMARREFLNQDHYLPLAEKIASLIVEYTAIKQYSAGARLPLFDAGCGEGYYLRKVSSSVQAQMSDDAINIKASGIDISRAAVQKAAKQAKEHHYAVASTYALPLNDGSQHAVIQVFAPSDENEIKRVLSDNGIWITVNPAPSHLTALKQMVYDNAQQHKANLPTPKGFKLLSHQQLNVNVTLPDEASRLNLLMMTPYFWSISTDKKNKLIEELQEVEASFDINVYGIA
ncbi:MAG: methyltransferase domain-containing protein [Glaciecola sp.]